MCGSASHQKPTSTCIFAVSTGDCPCTLWCEFYRCHTVRHCVLLQVFYKPTSRCYRMKSAYTGTGSDSQFASGTCVTAASEFGEHHWLDWRISGTQWLHKQYLCTVQCITPAVALVTACTTCVCGWARHAHHHLVLSTAGHSRLTSSHAHCWLAAAAAQAADIADGRTERRLLGIELSGFPPSMHAILYPPSLHTAALLTGMEKPSFGRPLLSCAP